MIPVVVSDRPYHTRESYERLRRFYDRLAQLEREQPAAFDRHSLIQAHQLATGKMSIDDYAEIVEMTLHDDWLPEAST